MDFIRSVFGRTLFSCCRSMRWFGGIQYLIVVISVISACAYGLTVDLSRLRQLRRPYILEKREGDESCLGNPCPPWKPFLCQSSAVCIALQNVCDDNPDCPDHFDEDKELCNARKRPPVEEIYKWLDRNRKWIVQKLFSGADPELIAHALAVGTSLDDVAMMVGLSREAENNLEAAFIAVLEGDERPLRKLGMPRGEWWDTQTILSKLANNGLF